MRGSRVKFCNKNFILVFFMCLCFICCLLLLGGKSVSAEECTHQWSADCDDFCDECGYTREVSVEHNITSYGDWGDYHEIYCSNCCTYYEMPHEFNVICYNDKGHYNGCICGAMDPNVTEETPHTFDGCEDQDCNDGCGYVDTSRGHKFVSTCDSICNNCGYVRPNGGGHYWISNYEQIDSEKHLATCEECGETFEEVHKFVYTENSSINGHTVTCSGCGYSYEDEESHSYSYVCDVDCDICKAERIAEEHTWTADCDKDCNVCGEIRDTDHELPMWGCTDVDGSYHKGICKICNEEILAYHETYDDGIDDGYCDTTCKYCGYDSHKDFNEPWITEDAHWFECTYCASSLAEESGGSHIYLCTYIDETTHLATCSVDWCGYSKEEGHTYNIYKYDSEGNGHWLECACGARESDEIEPHTLDSYAVSLLDESKHVLVCSICDYHDETSAVEHDWKGACDEYCDVCQYERSAVDSHNYECKGDADQHWQECKVCKVKTAFEEHLFRFEWDDITGKCINMCMYCSYVCEELEHEYVWTYTSEYHYNKCTRCDLPGSSLSGEQHTFDGVCDTDCNDGCGYTRPGHVRTADCDTICNECGEEIEPKYKHSNCSSLEEYDSKTHYFHCEDCGMDVYEEHDFSYDDNGNGTHMVECMPCGYFLGNLEHDFSMEYDQDGHWGVCDCRLTTDYESHQWTDKYDTLCDVCDYERVIIDYEVEISISEIDFYYYRCYEFDEYGTPERTFYIRNLGTEPVTLKLNTNNLTSFGVSSLYDGYVLGYGEELEVYVSYLTTGSDDTDYVNLNESFTVGVLENGATYDIACLIEINHEYWGYYQQSPEGHREVCCCGKRVAELYDHSYEISPSYNDEEKYHISYCYECGYQVEEEHDFDNACDDLCDICYYSRTITHDYEYNQQDGQYHNAVCNVCGETETLICNPVYINQGETGHIQKCQNCNWQYGDLISHGFDYSFNDTDTHLRNCYDCGYQDYVEHRFNDEADMPCDETCEDCYNYSYVTVNRHNYDQLVKNEYEHYYLCSICELDNTIPEVHSYQYTVTEEQHSGVCSVCGWILDEEEHLFVLTGDENNHWYECECSKIKDGTFGEHTFDNACDVDCNECGYKRNVLHDYSILKTDETYHWYECSVCGAAPLDSYKENHYFWMYFTTEIDGEYYHWQECEDCGYKLDYEKCSLYLWSYVDSAHIYECRVCGEQIYKSHVFDDCTDITCNECDYNRPYEWPHFYTVNSYDDLYHWKECEACGFDDDSSKEYHSFDSPCDTECNDGCGYIRNINHNLYLESDDEHHWYECSICDYVSDEVESHDYFGNYGVIHVDGVRYHYQYCSACEHKTDTTACTLIFLDEQYHYFDCDCHYHHLSSHTYDGCSDLKCNECGYERTSVSHCFDMLSYKEIDGVYYHFDYCYECGYEDLANKNICTLEDAWYSSYDEEEGHYEYCSSCGREEFKEHVFDNCEDSECDICGYYRYTDHKYIMKNDEEHHWYECSVCNLVDESTKGTHDLSGAKVCEDDLDYHMICCSECGYTPTGSAKEAHVITSDYDGTYHWSKCSVCNTVIGEKIAHQFDNCSDLLCEGCGYERAEGVHVNVEWISVDYDFHTYKCLDCGFESYETFNHDLVYYEYKDENEHYYMRCTICDYNDTESHWTEDDSYDEVGTYGSCWCGHKSYSEIHIFDNECDEDCNNEYCSYERVREHNYEYKYDDYVHYYECSSCGDTHSENEHQHLLVKNDENVHWYECECGHKDPTAINKHIYTFIYDDVNHWSTECSVCGYATEAQPHNIVASYDDNYHFQGCTDCDFRVDEQAHIFDDDCDVDCDCGYYRIVNHNYVASESDDLWHTWICSLCGDQYDEQHQLQDISTEDECKYGCSICGYVQDYYGSHSFGECMNINDPNYHQIYCVFCGTYKSDGLEEHVFEYYDEEHMECSTKYCICCGYEEYRYHNYELNSNDEYHWYECSTCGDIRYDEYYEHNHNLLKFNDTHHWYECNECFHIELDSWTNHNYANYITDEAAHWGGVCTDCGKEAEKGYHDFIYEHSYYYDSDSHWQHCKTCDYDSILKHSHMFDNSCDETCNQEGCDYIRSASHVFSTAEYDDEGCWLVCEICGDTTSKSKHNFYIEIDGREELFWGWDEGDQHYIRCTSGCGYRTGFDEHIYNIHTFDEDYHWTYCECGSGYGTNHSFSGDCDISCNDSNCQYERTPLAEHEENTYFDYNGQCAFGCPVCMYNIILVDHNPEWRDDYFGYCHPYCTECGAHLNDYEGVAHDYSVAVLDEDEYEQEYGHYMSCSRCGAFDYDDSILEVIRIYSHNFNEEYDTDCIDDVCVDCGYVRKAYHDEEGIYTDETHHWYKCNKCGDSYDVEEHYEGDAVNNYDGTHTYYCNCGYEFATEQHNFVTYYECNKVCADCGEEAYYNCNLETIPFNECPYEEGTWEYDDYYYNYDYYSNYHYYKCTNCGTITYEDHMYDNDCDPTCNTIGCGYERDTEHYFSIEYDDINCFRMCYNCWNTFPLEGNTEILPHELEYYSDSSSHWQECKHCSYSSSKVSHDFTTEHSYEYDDDFHWQHCDTCGYDSTLKHSHIFDNACDITCNQEGCDFERSVGEHQYDNNCDTNCNNCGLERTVGDHIYDNACDTICKICRFERTVEGHKYDNNCDTDCNNCGLERTITHNYSVLNFDGDKHWMECSVCESKDANTVVKHNYEISSDENNCWLECSCGKKASIEANNESSAPEVPHNWQKMNDAGSHWLECSDCGRIKDKVSHDCVTEHTYNYDEEYHWLECSDCGYKSALKYAHVFDNNCDTGCNQEGCTYTRSAAHKFDNDCDADCNDGCGYVREVTHDYSVISHDEEKHWNECSVCGDVDDDSIETHELNENGNCNHCEYYKENAFLAVFDWLKYVLGALVILAFGIWMYMLCDRSGV